MKIWLFITLLLVSMELFAGYPGTPNNAGALVVMDKLSDVPTPHYFKIGGGGTLLWFTTPNHGYEAEIVGCPAQTIYDICHLKLSWLGATKSDWQPYIFVQDDKGKVWLAQRSSLDNKTWTWREAGCPSLDSFRCGKLRGLGATSVTDDLFVNEGRRPYLFVTNDKGNVFSLSRDADGKTWKWSDLKCPGGKCDKEKLEGLGAINVFDSASKSERPYLFVIDDNTSKVWNLWRDVDGKTWRWSDMKCPDEKCDKKYNGLGSMMTSTMMRTTIDNNGIDIGKPRLPYVFVQEEENPDEVYYLWWSDEESVKQKWTWSKLTLLNTKQIIGVVPVLYGNKIIPVIAAETKDKKIVIKYAYTPDPHSWFTREFDCSLCPFNNAITFSRTHNGTGNGPIVYESSLAGSKQVFTTYWF